MLGQCTGPKLLIGITNSHKCAKQDHIQHIFFTETE